MKIYCGQTRSAALVEELKQLDIGECTVRGELKSRRRSPWFYDNGAFRDWQAGRDFNAIQFTRDMRRIRYSRSDSATPTFVVLPDIVGGGERSLHFSGEWWHDVEGLPSALAVQDGMTEDLVARWLDQSESSLSTLPGFHPRAVSWIFVGGTLEWKLATSASWARFAHDRGMFVHVGRVGIPDRLRMMHAAEVDSVDSSFPLMARQHFDRWIETVHELRAQDASYTQESA